MMRFMFFIGLLFPLFLSLAPVSLQAKEDYIELKPVSVVTDCQAHSSSSGQYAAEKMIDDNPATYACLLDTTRTGNLSKTVPPKADPPVTGRLVLDFGSTVTLSGIVLTSRNTGNFYNPKIVSVWQTTSADTAGKSAKIILKSQKLLPSSHGKKNYLSFPHNITARYILLEIEDSYECGPVHYNFQIAEIRGFFGKNIPQPVPNSPAVAFPEKRLFRDWLYQDYGLDPAPCFTSQQNANIERKIVTRVLDILKRDNADVKFLRNAQAAFDKLVKDKVPGNNPQWRELYHRVCIQRRSLRLEAVQQEAGQIIYAKHCVLSGSTHYSWTDEVTDQQYVERIADFRPGALLCRLTLLPDGTVTNEVLLEKPDGMIRDPNLSWDGTELVFSARENYKTDDFHLYIMNLADKSVRQITRDKAVSDLEPAFLPNGDIVFQSTRCVQLTDCWRQAVSNIYTCTAKGEKLRRLCFDQVHTNYPQILDDGRVIYTRWEYNDRGQTFPHPLFTMNSDGTAQTAFYGENSWFPTSILHARGVPGTNKVVGIASGHHTHQRGKLILVDRGRGTQGNDGIEFLAPRRPSNIPPIEKYKRSYDAFGQEGEQFQYPYSLDEENYLVTYSPEGYYSPHGRNSILYDPPFGVYWIAADGRRELLAWDPTICCCQQVPVMKRAIPPMKPSQVKWKENTGSYYLQDVYIGEPMKGIERGTAKKIRVVGIEYRAADILYNSNVSEVGSGHSRTPISINNGSWDVKHVLGEVAIEQDGSAYFKAPARTPLYFQVLDNNGYVIATMRSWSTLQPGELFSCIGCHEDKLQTYPNAGVNSMAMKKPIQKLQKSPGRIVDPSQYGSPDSVSSYLGINSAKGQKGPFPGFSYPREIQPIWDRHCISCHDGSIHNGKSVPLNLTGKVGSYTLDQCPNNGDKTQNALRDFSVSYLQLTNYGHGGPLVNWIGAQSRPSLLPSRFAGAYKSNLMKYLDGSHYKATLTDTEKRTVACWIDLCVPFCGSYTEANQWTDEQKKTYEYFEQKRKRLAAEELR